MPEPKQTPAAPATPAPAAVTPGNNAPDITGLPTLEDAPDIPEVPITGTVAEMLTLGKSRRKAAQPTPAPAEPKPVEMDEVDKKLKGYLDKHFGRRKKPAPAPAAPEPEPTPTPEPTAAEPKPAPAKQPKKQAVVKDKAAELAERFAELERQRLELDRQRLEMEKARQAPAQPQPQPQSLEFLGDDERYELEVIQKMAALNPDKYRDLPKRFTDLAQATADYKSKWESNNDGEAFDPDDAAHDAFFAKNQIRYDKRDYRKAELALVQPEQPKDEAALKEIRELKAKERVREVMPRAIQVFAENVENLLSALDPDMAKAAREGGRDQLMEEFPGEADEVLKAAASIEAVSIEAHKILETEGLVDIDPKNQLHALIIDIIRRKEPVTLGERDAEGRPFATWEQWARMTEQQRAAHWHLGAEEVVDIITQDMAVMVRANLDKFNKVIEAKAKKASAKNSPEPTPRPSPAVTPGSASRVTVDTSGKLRKDNNDAFQKTISSVLFKRSS